MGLESQIVPLKMRLLKNGIVEYNHYKRYIIMKNRHEVFKNTRLRTLKYIIINLVAMAISLSLIVYTSIEVIKEVKEVGLKNIVSEIWEGEPNPQR
jgi:hypothetical protein